MYLFQDKINKTESYYSPMLPELKRFWKIWNIPKYFKRIQKILKFSQDSWRFKKIQKDSKWNQKYSKRFQIIPNNSE